MAVKTFMGTSKPARPEWADRLEKLREGLGLSQAALAKRLNVSPMAPSRWERGINQPPASVYVKLGKMAGDPGCWYFWERAGLHRSDLAAVMPAVKRRPHPGPNTDVVPVAGSLGSSATEPKALIAVPLLANVKNGQPQAWPLLDRATTGEYVVAPKAWCSHPEKTVCVIAHGSNMAPMLRPGNIVAVDEAENKLDKLLGKIVLAQSNTAGMAIGWLQRYGKADVLVPENREFAPVYLTGDGWQIVGRILWWFAKAP
jgi:SOS-response transcriptional repressor LexA